MGSVFANGRSILYKGDGNTHVSAAPDVCKVPSPAGPVPTPFVNSAEDAMLSKGSQSVTIEGQPVGLTSSEISTSTGDEPGTAGGLVSSKFKGKMTWGSGSVDVKVEGKGVVRFLDPTLHNGNTFNTSFISAGGTGLAYGDDALCTACGKAVESHRVHETPEVVAQVENVFVELMKLYEEQRPLIDEYLATRAERNRVEAESVAEVNRREELLKPKKARREELLKLLKGANGGDKGALTAELGPLQAELKNGEMANKEIRSKGKAEFQARSEAMLAINAQLLSMGPVLRLDDGLKTYVEGYMVGACVCKCPQNPRQLAACSGTTAPGFQKAVGSTAFTLVEGFAMSDRQRQEVAGMGRDKWECSAPKLLQAGGAGGHKVRAMSERYFSPRPEVAASVSVEFLKTDEQGTRRVRQDFNHGESVPSCSTCQALTPEMLCDNEKECA